MVCLTPLLAKLNVCIPTELKSISVPPPRSKTLIFLIWWSKAELDQTATQQSPPPASPDQSPLIFLDPFLQPGHKLEAGLIHFTLGRLTSVTQVPLLWGLVLFLALGLVLFCSHHHSISPPLSFSFFWSSDT